MLRSLIVTVALVVAMGCGGGGSPEEEAALPPADAGETDLIEAGNTICPVMGAGVAPGQFFDWEGYRIGICCPGCETSFRNNPEIYIPVLLEDPGITEEARTGLSSFIETAEENQ